jgi:hypothetical protein
MAAAGETGFKDGPDTVAHTIFGLFRIGASCPPSLRFSVTAPFGTTFGWAGAGQCTSSERTYSFTERLVTARLPIRASASMRP